ncbi:MAG TPA: hypothetical protein VK540_21470 [Polyangiaceae bacterium]|nr:hypothetical protein [Polyangiaceae bacterium]
MWVEAILSKDNVISLMGDFLPLSIHLGENADDGHYLELFEPRQVALVEEQGLRVTCGARIRWPILGIDLPVTVDSVTLLLCPSIPGPPAQDELIFRLTVEAIDFAWTPSAIDDRIAEKINHELAKKHALLSWRFGETLSHVFEMPRFLPPLDAVALAVAWGQVRVTSEAMVIVVSFHSRVLRGDGELSERAGPRDELALTELAPPTGAKRANLATLGARPNGMARFVALAGGAALATLAAWAVVGIGASAWRYAAGRR